MSQVTAQSAAVPLPRAAPEGLGAAASAVPPAPAAAPALDGLGQVVSMARDGLAGLAGVHRSPRRAVVLAVWLVAIVGDAVTTIVLLGRPGNQEANPWAVVGMGFLGVPGYVALASAISLVFAVVSTGRALGPAAQVAALFLFAVAAGKLWVFGHNLLLWWAPR